MRWGRQTEGERKGLNRNDKQKEQLLLKAFDSPSAAPDLHVDQEIHVCEPGL